MDDKPLCTESHGGFASGDSHQVMFCGTKSPQNQATDRPGSENTDSHQPQPPKLHLVARFNTNASSVVEIQNMLCRPSSFSDVIVINVDWFWFKKSGALILQMSNDGASPDQSLKSGNVTFSELIMLTLSLIHI